jgi:beta-glucosidase
VSTSYLARRVAFAAVVAVGLLGGCARVIGLEDDYYQADVVGTGGEAGASGTSGTCEDHPIPSPSSWKVTASHQQENNGPSHVIDGTSARWSSGKPQSGNEWLEVDFGRPVSLRTINLQQGENTNDYPRGYAVRVSDESADVESPVLAMGVGTVGVSTPIVLAKPATGRYLSIRQLGTSLSWWSVAELEVSCFED